MPIASYLVYPMEGKQEALMADYSELPGCEVVPSENSEVFILVMESDDETKEKEILEQVRVNDNLQCLALVYGQFDEEMQE